jgi:hypothetical protein
MLAKQTAKGEKLHEATDAAAYAAAPWDFDGVGVYIDIANGRVPTVGEFVVSLALNSARAADVYDATAGAPHVRSASSGTADAGDRVVEARVAWTAVLDHATNKRSDVAQRLGTIGSGFRFGCEPRLIEFNHTRQSHVGGAQYTKPSGRDANSIDVVLRDGNRQSRS